MGKRTPYSNRFDSNLFAQLKQLSDKTQIDVSMLLDEAVSLLLVKYQQPEQVPPVTEKVDDAKVKQIVISVPQKRKRTGSLRLHKGQWYALFMLGSDENGKRRRKEIYLGVASKISREEAQKKLELIADQIESQLVKEGD